MFQSSVAKTLKLYFQEFLFTFVCLPCLVVVLWWIGAQLITIVLTPPTISDISIDMPERAEILPLKDVHVGTFTMTIPLSKFLDLAKKSEQRALVVYGVYPPRPDKILIQYWLPRTDIVGTFYYAEVLTKVLDSWLWDARDLHFQSSGHFSVQSTVGQMMTDPIWYFLISGFFGLGLSSFFQSRIKVEGIKRR